MQKEIEWGRATLLHKHLEAAAEQLTLRCDVIPVIDGQSRKEEDEGGSQEAVKECRLPKSVTVSCPTLSTINSKVMMVESVGQEKNAYLNMVTSSPHCSMYWKKARLASRIWTRASSCEMIACPSPSCRP